MEHYSVQQQSGNSLNLAMNSTNTPLLPQQLDPEMEQQMFAVTSHQHQQQQPSTRYMNQRDKVLMYQLNQYYMAKATTRSKNIARTIQEVVKIVHNVLRELEIQEPRFISTFTEVNGHYEGKYRKIFQLNLTTP